MSSSWDDPTRLTEFKIQELIKDFVFCPNITSTVDFVLAQISAINQSVIRRRLIVDVNHSVDRLCLEMGGRQN